MSTIRMMEFSDSKYLEFLPTPTKTKTSVHLVLSKSDGSQLGRVQWYAPWRKFCFYPTASAIFDAQCLLTIKNFIDELMQARNS